MLWPDLTRFGWSMGIIFKHENGKNKPGGLFLEKKIEGDGLNVLAATDFGFTQVDAAADQPLRYESNQMKFNRQLLMAWFPGFDASRDMKDTTPPFLEEQAAMVMTLQPATDWPRTSDLEAIDTKTGQHGWEMTKNQFNELVQSRSLRLTISELTSKWRSPLNLHAEKALAEALDLSVDDPQIGRYLGSLAHAARMNKESDWLVIDRVGEIILMPPLRIFSGYSDNLFFAEPFANHKTLVESALIDYDVPNAVRSEYGYELKKCVEMELSTDFFDSEIEEEKRIKIESTTTSRKKRISKDAKTLIDDVGLKIGGARKDFHIRPLTTTDLDQMNASEVSDFVKKANIWSWSVNEALKNGTSTGVVQWIKTFRRLIKEYNPLCNSLFNASDYIKSVEMLKEAIGSPKTKEELVDNIRDFRIKLINEGHYTAHEDQNTGVITHNFSKYSSGFNKYFLATGGAAWGMAKQSFVHVTYGLSKEKTIDRSVMGWHLSKAQYYEENPEWALKKLLPTRTATPSTDEPTEVPQVPIRPHLASLEYKGFSSQRQNRSISANELLTHFGFSGVEFGNWVPQDERQMVINFAYDAMMALSETYQVPVQMMSLHGRLSLAFGSRGKGGKSAGIAHYEPNRHVINLTRINGAGALAHEWFHALDHYLGDLFKKNGLSHIKEKYFSEMVGAFQFRNSDSTIAQKWSSIFENVKNISTAMTSIRKDDTTLVEHYKKRAISFSSNLLSNLIYEYLTIKPVDSEPSNQYSYSGQMKRASEIGQDIAQEIMVKCHMPHTHNGRAQAFDASKAFDLVKDRLKEDFNKKVPNSHIQNLIEASYSMAQADVLSRKPEDRNVLIALYGREKREAFFGNQVKENAIEIYTELGMSALRIHPTTEYQDTNFLKESKLLDGKRSKPYWSTPIEMFARAGEQSIFYAMKKNEAQADYLVHGVEESRYTNKVQNVGNPYPTGDERKILSPLFESFIKESAKVVFSYMVQPPENLPSSCAL